jgi:hypothetical protein
MNFPQDDLEAYLRGGSALSRLYRRLPADEPPRALDAEVLSRAKLRPAAARPAGSKSLCLAPMAFAASVLLSVALVLAIAFGPQAVKVKNVDEAPRVYRAVVHGGENATPQAARPPKAARAALHEIVPRFNQDPRLYSSDPPRLRTAAAAGDAARDPRAWLADIAALRRAGRGAEAGAEFRRFRAAYPNYPADDTQ